MTDNSEKKEDGKKSTTLQSITDTDAEESDSGDIIREITELINTDESTSLTDATDEVKTADSAIASDEEQDNNNCEGCETSEFDEPVIKQSFQPRNDLSIANTKRSLNSDETTDDANTGVTRGTKSRLGQDHHVISPSDVTNLDKDLREKEADSSSLHTTDIPCHPSKLTHQRGDSISTFQPNSLEQHTMSPNFSFPTKDQAGPADQDPECSQIKAEENGQREKR
mmetsp:Transcript_22212/g.33702  ORF Transcript_22212/g.33702 Transcript_22212/m.33702 type:complete len:225 (-) Transcript_22212:7-681(-)